MIREEKETDGSNNNKFTWSNLVNVTEIGQGSFGTTFRATDKTTNRTMAVKRIGKTIAAADEDIESDNDGSGMYIVQSLDCLLYTSPSSRD